MKMVTIREFRANPTQSLQPGNTREDVVLTSNGKPVALLFPVTEDNLEESLKMARQYRARRAVHNIRMRAAELGLDKMTMDEIDAEIAAVRKDMKKGQAQ